MADITDTVAKDVWIVLPASADDNCINAIKGRTSVLRLTGSAAAAVGTTDKTHSCAWEFLRSSHVRQSFFFLTFLASSSVKLIHWFQNAAPVPSTQDGINFPRSAQITVASVTWRDLQRVHGGDGAGPGVTLSPQSKITPESLSGSFETTRLDWTYGEIADLSRETRHWIWTKALVKPVPGSPEQVSMFLAYSGGGVL